MQPVTIWDLLQFLFVTGLVVTILGAIILRLTDDNPRPGRVRKLVNGKRIWVNAYETDVEFIYDPKDPAGQLRPEDFHMLEREDETPRKLDRGEGAK